MLGEIGRLTLASHSLVRRLFSDDSLKEIKGCLRKAEKRGLVVRFEYPDFHCFGLSEAGFVAVLDI